MRDTDLYRQLPGLVDPWTVDRVELDVKLQRVEVWAKHDKVKAWPSPECGKSCGLHDHDEERTWRDLDSCSFQTHLHARVPRVNCPEHRVRQVKVVVGRAQVALHRVVRAARDRRLAGDERDWCDVARPRTACSRGALSRRRRWWRGYGATTILGLSWDEAFRTMERAVARGLMVRPRRAPRLLGVDEKSLAKGQRYATVACDLEHGHVIDVAEGRTMDRLLQCLGRFSVDDLTKVEAIAMDMWEPYAQFLRSVVDDADDKIVFDRFHIFGHIHDAVDLVRRKENKMLRAAGDDRLVGTKHLWLYGKENLEALRADLETKLDFAALRSSSLKTARAWALKESLRELWRQRSRAAGERWWQRWYGWAIRSRLAPVKKVAAMIKRHLPNVLTYFKHRITNAGSEAINSVLQMLKKRAFGYRSVPNFRTVVLFRCGGLRLYPAHPKAG